MDWSQISVILITRNADEVLAGALQSIPSEAEMIVADADSRDRTAAIARGHGARMIAQDTNAIDQADGNFDIARNHAARHASRPWSLFLDADERLSPALAHEIQELDPKTPHAAFRMPRQNLFWKRSVRLLGDDFQLRLVRNGKGRYEGTMLHRPMQVDGSIGELRSPLIHQNIRSWKDVTRRFRDYVPIESRSVESVPDRWTAFTMPLHMFRFYYFRQRAWRDGPHGLLVCALYAAYHGAVAWRARRRPHA